LTDNQDLLQGARCRVAFSWSLTVLQLEPS
jgi:hypothetical protein